MAFDWNQFLALAEELADRADDASKRTAISRAYYCIFNLAFARAETSGCTKPKGVSYHQWCWEQYTNSGDWSCKQLGLDGDRMRWLRVKADYKEAEIYRLDDKVRRMLQDAHEFLKDLAALDPTFPRP